MAIVGAAWRALLMCGDGFVADRCGKDELVGDGAGSGGEAGGEACDAGGEPGLRGDDDLGAASELGVPDAFGSVLNGRGDAGCGGAKVEPGFFFFDVADELGSDLRASAHEAGADSGDADALGAKLGVEAFGVAGESELGGGIRQEMGNGHFAADGGDVHDGGSAAVVATQRGLREEMRQECLGGVEGGEEVVLHGGLEGLDRLIFDGAYLDDAGAVDEDIHALQMADGELDHGSGGIIIGEIGGQEKDVTGSFYVSAEQERVAGLLQLILTARDEDETGAAAAIDAGELKAKAGGAAGDEDDGTMFAGGLGTGAEEPGGGDGGEGHGDLGGARGVEGGHTECDAGLRWGWIRSARIGCVGSKRVHSCARAVRESNGDAA